MKPFTLPYPPTTNNVDREALSAAYGRLGNVHKAAAECGVSHSVAHRRLKAWGVMRGQNLITQADREMVRAYYQQTNPRDFDLATLALRLGRTRAVVSRLAGEMGLSDPTRPKSTKGVLAMTAAVQGKWSRAPHPKGFAAKTHGEGARAIMSERARAAWVVAKATATIWMTPENLQNMSDKASARMALQTGENAYSRARGGRRADIGPMYFRSAWEANYARYLNWLLARGEIDRWEYEPENLLVRSDQARRPKLQARLPHPREGLQLLR